MRFWETLRRMATLRKRWNSVADVREDPVCAINAVCDVLRHLQFVLAVAGNVTAYDRVETARRILQEVKECLHER